MKIFFTYLSLIIGCITYIFIFKATEIQCLSPRKGLKKKLYKNVQNRRKALKCSSDRDCEKHSSLKKHECFVTVSSNDDYVGYCKPLHEERECKRHKRTRLRSCKQVWLHCKSTKECPSDHKCMQTLEPNRGTCIFVPNKFLASSKVKYENEVIELDGSVHDDESLNITVEEFLKIPIVREDPADDPFDIELSEDRKEEKENPERNSFLQMMHRLSGKTPLQAFENKCSVLTHSSSWSRICNLPSIRDKYANKKVNGGEVKLTHIIVKNSDGKVLKGSHFSMSYLKKCTEGASKILQKGLGFKLVGKVKTIVSDDIYHSRPKSLRDFADQYRIQHFHALNIPSPRRELVAFWRHISPKTLGLSAFPGSSKPYSKGMEGVFDMTPLIKQTHWQCSSVLAHELGHSLGLFHTHRTIEQTKIFEHKRFANICTQDKCGEFSYANAKEDAFDDLRGDFCSDTPPEPNLNSFKGDAYIKNIISNHLQSFQRKAIDAPTYEQHKREFDLYINTGKIEGSLKGKLELLLKRHFQQTQKHKCGYILYEKFATNIMSYSKMGTEFTPQQRARAFCFAANVDNLKSIFPLADEE